MDGEGGMNIQDSMTKEQRALEMAQGTVGYDRFDRPKQIPGTNEFEWTSEPNGGRTIVFETKFAATLCGFVIAKGLPDPFCFDTPEAAVAYGLELQAEQREIAKAAGLL